MSPSGSRATPSGPPRAAAEVDAKRGALTAAILGSSIVAVDATVVNVALPTIADDLGGGIGALRG